VIDETLANLVPFNRPINAPMKNSNRPLVQLLLTGLSCSAILLANTTLAQSKLVDRRDQAEGWYVPIHGQVIIDGKSATAIEITLYKDNVVVRELESDKHGRFELELDLDAMYNIRVNKEGYQQKLVLIDTRLPENLVKYPGYVCTVSLQKEASKNIDPFYADFPSATVRFNEELGGFYHSEHYLTHIQTKLAGYASVSF